MVKVNMLFIFGKSNGLGLVQTSSERLRLWHHQDWKWLRIKTVSLQSLFPSHGNLLWYCTVNVIQETHRHPDKNKTIKKKKEKKLGLTYNTRAHLVKLKAITAQLSQIQMFKEVGNEKYIEDMRTSVMKVTQLRNVQQKTTQRNQPVYFFLQNVSLYVCVYLTVCMWINTWSHFNRTTTNFKIKHVTSPF